MLGAPSRARTAGSDDARPMSRWRLQRGGLAAVTAPTGRPSARTIRPPTRRQTLSPRPAHNSSRRGGSPRLCSGGRARALHDRGHRRPTPELVVRPTPASRLGPSAGLCDCEERNLPQKILLRDSDGSRIGGVGDGRLTTIDTDSGRPEKDGGKPSARSPGPRDWGRVERPPLPP